MQEHGMYFGKEEIYEKRREVGGVWNDGKKRPIVCLIESVEIKGLYWAIPFGNWNHRDEKGKKRIMSFIEREERDIRSCFYHIGNTTVKSIFFISDVIPITDKYIEREYSGHNNQLYIIKNKKLLAELERKVMRILQYENGKKNYYRQHITDIKSVLIQELSSEISSDG